MPRPKVVEESESRADEDREAGDGDGRLRLKLEEVDEHGIGDSSTTDASDGAQRHNNAKDEQAPNFEAFLREDRLVLTDCILANVERIIVTVVTDSTCPTLCRIDKDVGGCYAGFLWNIALLSLYCLREG